MARTWLSHSRSRLGPSSTAVVSDLRTGAVQYLAYGASPIGSSNDLGEALEAALRAPTRDWARQLATIDVAGWHLPAPGISAGLARLERSTMRFFDAAIAPYWPAAQREAEQAVAGWTAVMARSGVGAMLAQLHPEITWSPPHLVVDNDAAEAVCPPGCVHIVQDSAWKRTPSDAPVVARPSPAGLVILPTVFGRPARLRGRWRTELVSVPIPVRPTLFNDEPAPVRPAEQLLGPTRAWVLQACVENELTTSGIAHVVGVSVSSASEHAATLRRSGLLTSKRNGQAVLHTATGLGRQVMRADALTEDHAPRRYFATGAPTWTSNGHDDKTGPDPERREVVPDIMVNWRRIRVSNS